MKQFVRRFVVALAIAYPSSLFIAGLLLRFVGERWWVTSMLLYVPRVVLGAPLFVLAPALLWLRMPKWLWTQALAAWLWLGPLMGFELPVPRFSAHGPSLRVMSYNVNHCSMGSDGLSALVARYAPDVLLLQEFCGESDAVVAELKRAYVSVRVDDQFLIASRFALNVVSQPGRIQYKTRSLGERFMRYVVAGPSGPLAIYNMHPLSPRAAMYVMRGDHGFRREVWSGHLFEGESEIATRDNSELRAAQLTAAVTRARSETTPVILAGDTNLPWLSPVLEGLFSDYQDGFRRAGWGFGYTFPSGRPWMRIDRIFASSQLHFLHFEVGCGYASDHRCVIADLEVPR